MNKNKLSELKQKNIRFKAGDFTSGKMGDIFKSCHHSLDLVFVDHKQFGAANLIPEEYIAFIVVRALKDNTHFKGFIESECDGLSFLGFTELTYDDAFNVINDYLCEGFSSWFDVMVGLILVWGRNDKNM